MEAPPTPPKIHLMVLLRHAELGRGIRWVARYPATTFLRQAPGVTPAHWRNAWLKEPSDA